MIPYSRVPAVREFVSCIMATRNRPRFFRQALRCYLRQSYPRSELVVVDDGEQPVEEACARLRRVRYLRLGEPTPTGTKLNLGIAAARGDILQKLDDDDYYHPDFLATAVGYLPDPRREPALAAWDCFLILLAGESAARYSGHGWTAGGTLCFSRRLWERAPFHDVAAGEDSAFVLDHQRALVRVCAPEMYLMVRHGANTWTRMLEGDRADDYLRQLPAYEKPLAALVDRAAARFYRSLGRGAG